MNKTITRTQQILKVLRVITWIAYIGFNIEAGAILIAFIVSWFNPEASGHIYKATNENLMALRTFSFAHYVISVSLMFLLPVLKSVVCWLIIKTLSAIKIRDPFTENTAGMLTRCSYLLLAVWIVTAIDFIHQQWVYKLMGHPLVGELGGESLLIAGLVFVIAQIFKRGVEIQSENELTV